MLWNKFYFKIKRKMNLSETDIFNLKIQAYKFIMCKL